MNSLDAMSPKMEPTFTTREGLAATSSGMRSRVSAIGAMTLVWKVRASPLLTPLVEAATIAGWSLAGQSVKCGGECTRVAEADI